MPRKALPKLPYPEFPLRPHANGSWFKSVWNPRSQRSEQFYFGSWSEDPSGDRALNDPNVGWLARRQAIKSGADIVGIAPVSQDLTLGELMTRFLTFKRSMVQCGELSLSTLDGYLKETSRFVKFFKPTMPVSVLRAEHFSLYHQHMIEQRKLGRFARKRVITYINTFLRFGAKNGWTPMPNAGITWKSPATDPDAMRLDRIRSGVMDYSNRLVTGIEIDRLLERAQPAFRALILLAANCGVGPADLARLRWHMIDLDRRRLLFPRGKTGVERYGFLWRKTIKALHRVRTLKHNRIALEQEGDKALVFLTRHGQPMYRESEVHETVEMDGRKIDKLVKVKVDCAIMRTFRRMTRELGIDGLGIYRLRHSFRTYGQRTRDPEALDACMGHRRRTVGAIYDHEVISWKRIRRVSRAVYRRLWPKIKPSADRPKHPNRRAVAAVADG